ncbi:hypothetical protein GF1_14640 [Desulfolithobacter dissulfuricans]|uniref:histidine kinase n=1 Tax=Desulfolithobacter dissulfuricans TaxID=2795293 RepID=A0A915XKE2_9BACT|nr:PAS domain S-box protein [Desulfolithobacter dissulfuricans]BCO09088.1 hypothetical protein GF1_14640 [Desulfolithobacter dissulfuricans]
MKKSSPIVYGSVLAVVTLIIAALIFIGKINRQRQAREIDVYQQFVEFETKGLLGRFEQLRTLNHLLTSDPTILDTLGRYKKGLTPDSGAIDTIDTLLHNIAQIQHVSTAYLLDTSGTCVFSSHPSFIGHDYSFRPYFTQALTRDHAIYVAREITSHQLGIYLAHPIAAGENVLGVAVLKIDPAFFDVSPIFSFTVLPLDQNQLRVGLVTEQGVFVDILGNTLHAMETLDPEQIKQLEISRQFPVKSIQNLSFPPGTWATVKRSGFLQQSAGGQQYYLFARPLGTTGLFFVHMAESAWFHSAVQPISGFYKALLLVFAFMLVIACALIYLFDKRHRTILEQSTVLAESEDKLRLFSKAVEQSGNSIIITDSRGDIIYVNPHFTRVTGYTLAEVRGKNPRVLKSGSQDSSVHQELWQTLTRGETWKGVLHNKKKNGELYWEEATISPIFGSDGETTHYIAIKEDISDRVALTQQLREEKEKLQLIVEHAGLGIAIIIERHISWVNQAGVDLFGYDSVDEVIGKSVMLIHASEEVFQQVGRQAYKQLSQENTVFKTEIRMRKKDGSLFWAAITGKALDHKRPDQAVIWIVEDIDQRKKDEEQLKQAKREAEEANAMKSRLLANISHDIRTPLHGILGTFSLLQAQPLGKEQEKLVITGNRAAEFLLNLLNNLLDLSKIEAGQLVLDNYPFSIRELLGEVGEILAGQFSQKSVAYRYQVASSIPEILIGDALRIKQIFINLVGNSLKFTEQGSVNVSVAGEREEDGNILLTCQVRDTGIGIAADRQERLFEAFTQADNSITRQFGGSGLGLSICRELCTLMGGRIWFESREGKGTTFYFTLRCTIASDQSLDRDMVESNESAPSLPKSPLAILIVDDNEANQDILRMMLERDGHRVHIAANGLLALEKLVDSSYDLIFMDMQMPVMDGLTATRLIRECEAGLQPDKARLVDPELLGTLSRSLRHTYTPIVALTANALQDDKRRCEEAGMDSYLIKPFQREQLLHILADFAPAPAPGSGDAEQTGAGHPIPDLDVLKGFIRERYPFSEEQITTLVTTTIETISGDLELLARHAGAGEMKEIGALAHKIKGSALNMGLEYLARGLSCLEEAAAEGDSGTCQRTLRDLELWWYRFSHQLDQNR